MQNIFSEKNTAAIVWSTQPSCTHFQIFGFVSSAHMGCSDIHLLSCTLRNFCNPPGFPFSSEGGDSGDMLMTVPVGGKWFMHWGTVIWSAIVVSALVVGTMWNWIWFLIVTKNPQTVPVLSFDSLHCHLCPHSPPHIFSAVKELNSQ